MEQDTNTISIVSEHLSRDDKLILPHLYFIIFILFLFLFLPLKAIFCPINSLFLYIFIYYIYIIQHFFLPLRWNLLLYRWRHKTYNHLIISYIFILSSLGMVTLICAKIIQLKSFDIMIEFGFEFNSPQNIFQEEENCQSLLRAH